jgi:hypothetical protein
MIVCQACRAERPSEISPTCGHGECVYKAGGQCGKSAVLTPDTRSPALHPAMTAREPPSARRLRSPSPIISFTASTLQSESKGVKNITQHVIKSLEGLGHFDFVDAQGRMVGLDERAEASLEGNDNHAARGIQPNALRRRQTNGHAKTDTSTTCGIQNGAARGTVAQPHKIDWEIPRKLLHSSIGAPFIRRYRCYCSNNTPIRLPHTIPLLVRRKCQKHSYSPMEHIGYRRISRYYTTKVPCIRATVRTRHGVLDEGK